MDIDQAALYAFLGLLVGGVFTFAREQIKWYQENYPKLEKVLEKQQGTLEMILQEETKTSADILAILEERLPGDTERERPSE